MFKLNYPKFWYKKSLISFCLIPFSWIYVFLGIMRQIVTSSIHLPSKVICVGNMTVGGSGKTQIVEFLADYFTKKKISFVIITKGYGSNIGNSPVLLDETHSTMDVGDESICLFQKGYQVIAAKKIKTTIALLEQIKPKIIIVDDGMQNPNFYKDFTILTIDQERGIGNSRIFPSGALRESPENAIKKSNLICFTGKKNHNQNDHYLKAANDKPIFYAQTKMLTKLDAKKQYLAFSGIGNPDKFFIMLKSNNIKLCDMMSFPDHHIYTQKELDALSQKAKKCDAMLVTTEKDFVKIPKKYNIIPVKVRLSFKNLSKLEKIINEKIIQKT